MIATKQVFDVFLSHGSQDTGLAKMVATVFREAGLGVFSVTFIPAGDNVQMAVREALADCSVVVLLLTRSTVDSSNVAFEVGVAIGWNKPVHVIFDGLSPGEIPAFLKSYHVSPVSQLSEVVARIRQCSMQTMSDEDRATLSTVYQQLGVPTDQLLLTPAKLRELTDEFNHRVKSALKGERLMQELIRLRKRGQLPKLTKRRSQENLSTKTQTS